MATLALAAAQPAMNRIVPAWKIAGAGWTASQVENAADGARPRSRSICRPPHRSRRRHQAWTGSRSRIEPGSAGVMVSLAMLLIGAAWLTWLTSRASDAGAQWQAAADDVRRRLEIRRPVRVAVTQHPAMLVTWGVIEPVILLPRTAAAWPADRIELVLAHEMAHLVRRDWLIQLFGRDAARDQLVQSAVLDRVRAPAPRKRIRLRRHRPRARHRGHHLRRPPGRPGAHVQRARPDLAAGAVHCTSVHP